MAAGKRRDKKEISTFFKIFLTTWAFVENGLFSGLRAGWVALVYILKQEHVYADLCSSDSNGNYSTRSTTSAWIDELEETTSSNSTIYFTSTQSLTTKPTAGCDAQDAVFNQCFTVASATMSLSALLYGHLNYKFGIRVPRLLSVVLFVGGTCCFAFVNKELPWLIFPGLLLVSSGGMALYITNNQISYMFKTRGSAVVGLLCGALEASAMVQSIIKILYQHGISLFISFLTLGGLYTMTLISTLCFLPKDYVTSEQITDSSIEVTANSKDVESENVPIIKHEKSNTQTTIGDEDVVTSTTESHTSTDTGIVSDAAISTKYESQNNPTNYSINNNSKDYFPSRSNDTNKNNRTLKENIDIYEEDPINSINGDDLEIQHEKLVSDLQKQSQNFKKNNNSVSKDSEKITSGTEGDTAEDLNDRGNGFTGKVTLIKYILTKTFLLYLFWAVAVQIILSMSLGTFNAWLEFVTNGDKPRVSEFTDILFYSMLGSPVLALLFGLGMDALQKVRVNNDTPPEVLTLRTATVSLAVTSILGVILCAFFMTCKDNIVIITSIALVVFRTGLYSCGTAFLRIMYPTNYFGILCGIMTVLAGGISYVQYPLFLWIQNRNQAWTEVFGFIGVIGLVSLVQPVYLQYKSRLYRKSFEARKNTPSQ